MTNLTYRDIAAIVAFNVTGSEGMTGGVVFVDNRNRTQLFNLPCRSRDHARDVADAFNDDSDYAEARAKEAHCFVMLRAPKGLVKVWEHASQEAAMNQAHTLADLFAVAFTQNDDGTEFTIDATSTFQPS